MPRFYKAFQLVFEKGGTVINKTYRKEDGEYRQKLNAYAAGLKENRKNLKAFSKQAGVSKTKNLLISGVEGIGTGGLRNRDTGYPPVYRRDSEEPL